VLQATGYPTVADSTLELKPSATGNALAGATPAAGSVTFTGDPRGMEGQATGNVAFTSAAATTDTVIAGLPTLDLSLSTTSPRVHIIANVFDQSPDGSKRRITQFAMNPELRNGTQDIAPVIPAQKMLIKPVPFAMGHHLLEGHKLVLQISTSDPRITIFTGPGETVLRLPVVTTPTLVDDVI
jgi:predicted acyl esterase